MNRGVLLFLAIASFVAGTTSFVLGSRYLGQLRDAEDGVTGGGSAWEIDRTYQQVPGDAQAKWLTDFTLIERSGRPVRWSDLRGNVTVTSFFFSSCPATCLQQNQKVGEIQRAFAGQDVVFLSITCDPDIDSPERLREYAAKLDADPKQWLFLTGELLYIRRVAGELFSVALDRQTHSERLIVTDKWGNIRGTFLWNKLDQITQLKLLVDKLLAETAEPAEFLKKKATDAAALAASAADSSVEAAAVGESTQPAEAPPAKEQPAPELGQPKSE